MPWEYLEDEAIADIGIQVKADNIEQLLTDAVLSIANLMTDLDGLENDQRRKIVFEATTLDTLLYKILDEMVYLKDAELFFVKDVTVAVKDYRAELEFTGTIFDRERHSIGNDIKAITLHEFYVKKENGGWTAHYIIDI